MWTCGMDMATQHARPATERSASKAFGVRPNGRSGRFAVAPELAWPGKGGRLRSSNASGSIVARQNAPSPIYVARQPAVSKKCCSTGGQTAPARELPLAQIATAIPRWRENHIEASATRGAKVAAQPSRPASSPCARLNCHSVTDMPQRRNPAPRLSAPITTGTVTPKRSESRPIRMPPTPKPTIVSVYGSDASARETPNSACRAGSATTTPYMAAPPMVMSSSAAPSLTQAYSDSASPLEEVLLSFMAAEINPKNPETHHGSPLQPVLDHQPGARRFPQARRAHRQAAVRRRLGAQAALEARPQPDHGGCARRAISPGPVARPPLARVGERRHARGDRRGDHPSRFLRGLAQRRHRRADRQAGLRRTQGMSRSRAKTFLLH